MAVQSTKQENSGLIGDIQRLLNKEIAQAVELHVNGRVRAIDTKLENYIISDKEHNENEARQSAEWRKKVDEKLEVVTNLQGFGRVAMYIMGFIGAVGVTIGVISKYLIK